MVHGPQSSRGARGLASARLGNHLKCRSHARIASFARLPEGAAAVAYGGFERQASGIVARAWYFFPRSSGQADCVRASCRQQGRPFARRAAPGGCFARCRAWRCGRQGENGGGCVERVSIPASQAQGRASPRRFRSISRRGAVKPVSDRGDQNNPGQPGAPPSLGASGNLPGDFPHAPVRRRGRCVRYGDMLAFSASPILRRLWERSARSFFMRLSAWMKRPRSLPDLLVPLPI